jgi:hypothetical protein
MGRSADAEGTDDIETGEDADDGQQQARSRRRYQPGPTTRRLDAGDTERDPEQTLDEEPRFVQEQVLQVRCPTVK